MRSSFCRAHLLALCVSLAACKTAPQPSTDSAPAKTTEEDASPSVNARFPMILPSQTAGVMRADLGRLNVFLTQLISLLEANERRDLTPSEPSGTYATHMTIGVLGALRNRQADGEERRLFLEGIDPQGEVLVAISFQGNEALIEAMRLGAPIDPVEANPHGPLFRVSLPARDATKLIKSLQLRSTMDNVERIERVGKHVEVDFRTRSQNAARVAAHLQPLPVDERADSTYLTTQSPALQAFLSSDAAIKVHIPSRSLTPLAALQAIAQVDNALMYTAPESRPQLQRRGVVEAASAFISDDPDSYEAFDTTLLMDINDAKQLSMSMVRGLTPHGVAIEEVLNARTPQPVTTLPDALFSATVAQNFAATRSTNPREMAFERDVISSFRQNGPLMLLAMCVQAPVANRAFILENLPERTPALFFAEAMHLHGAATSFEKPPFTFMFTMDLMLPRPVPPKLTHVAEQWKEMLKYSGLLPSATLKGERALLLAGAVPNDLTTRDVTLPDDTFAQAHLDLTKLATLIGTSSQNVLQNIPPSLISELSRLASVQLTGTSHDTHTLWHAYTGADAIPAPTIPPTAAPASSGSLPDCLFPAIHASREAQAALMTSAQDAEVFQNILDELKKLEASCKEGDAARRVMTARWLMARARHQPARALEDYSEACTLGLPLACAQRDAITKTK